VPGRQFDSDIQHLSLTPTVHVPTSSTPILVEPFDALSEAPSSIQDAVTSVVATSQESATKKVPKQVVEMEKRAKERKDKREQLKQAYEEKQRKADEERR